MLARYIIVALLIVPLATILHQNGEYELYVADHISFEACANSLLLQALTLQLTYVSQKALI